MRRALVPCLVLLAAGCGGAGGNSTFDAKSTTKCLEQQKYVVVTPTPKSQLGQVPGATDVLDVSFAPARAVVMFARSAGDEPHMEQSLDQLVHTALHASVKRVLHHSRNVAWAWIGQHSAADERALRRCLS